MPRTRAQVKRKLKSRSPTAPRIPGVIDLHFHGAFGIDLMSASHSELETLSVKLFQAGISGYCPTTLSDSAPVLLDTVRRLGAFIRDFKSEKAARPLGIHLEGPFISKEACGAHPREALRPARITELTELWDESHGTIKIITLAPEIHEVSELKAIASFAKKRKIRLSIGHSRASREEATRAFDLGFTGVTHLWNAMPFHHRDAGVLGAALRRKGVFPELIIDQEHVSREVLEWTWKLHGDGICFVSDAAPAAGCKEGAGSSFGSLEIESRGNVCVISGTEHIAGSALLLPEAFKAWIKTFPPSQRKKEFQARVCGITKNPARALGI